MSERLGWVLALAWASSACASGPQASPVAAVPVGPAGAPPAAAVAPPRAQARPSSAWDEQRQVAPKLGLTVGPACQQKSDCERYASQCTDQAICDGASCVPMASLGTNCALAGSDAASEPGICRQGACEPAAARPEVCGEMLLNLVLRSWGRSFVYGKHCSQPRCLEEQRRVLNDLDLTLGRSFVGCLAATNSGLVIPIDWSAGAPFASPFPLPAAAAPRELPQGGAP